MNNNKSIASKNLHRLLSAAILISIFLVGCQPKTKKGALSDESVNRSIRYTRVLSDYWGFQIDVLDIGERDGWFKDSFNRGGWAEVTVPMAWDCYETGLRGYEGVGWYSTTISPDGFEEGKRTEIIFGRVMYDSKVWLNGQYLGRNIGGYLPFSFDITGYLKLGKVNKLVVRVDNKPRPEEWLPPTPVIEWVQYGGILQPVKLVGTDHTYINDFTVRTEPNNGGAKISCMTSVSNETGTRGEMELEVTISRGEKIIKKSTKFNCAPDITAEVAMDIKMDQAELWSPDSPVLYTAMASLKRNGVLVDNISERIGIRKISTAGDSILLNDKPIYIKGVSRYDEYGQYGPNPPEELLREELEKMKSVGINMIRMHYPQSPDLLSLYDEYGFLVMEEVPINWWRENQRPDILMQAKPFLRGMIKRDKNHPSVVFWSMANESFTENETGATAMRELLRLAKELDPARLATFVVDAKPGPVKNPAYDEADIVCGNMYYGLFSSYPGKKIRHIGEIDSLGVKPTARVLGYYNKNINKPVIITEFGSQGIKNIHGDACYTEEFQAAYNEKIWGAITSTPGISGGVFWCWADYYHRRDFIGYAAFGPYGVVTVDRQPKKSLQSLARMYGGVVPEQYKRELQH